MDIVPEDKIPHTISADAANRLTKQFVALAKATPGKLNYASAGTGSAIHLAMDLFEDAAGIRLEHIAYKGANPAITDVLAGQVTVMFATTPPAVQYMQTGRLRRLSKLSGSSRHRTRASSGGPAAA